MNCDSDCELALAALPVGGAPLGRARGGREAAADRFGVVKNYAEKSNIAFNKSVFFAWLTSFVIFFGWSKGHL